jgi:hypothetical protein
MASYSIVLAPIAALMAFDFFVIKHRRVDIYQLYRPHGIYRFVGGWNWRSYVALVIAVVPNLPGMINAIDATVSPNRVLPGSCLLPALTRARADVRRYPSATSATSTCCPTCAATRSRCWCITC